MDFANQTGPCEVGSPHAVSSWTPVPSCPEHELCEFQAREAGLKCLCMLGKFVDTP